MGNFLNTGSKNEIALPINLTGWGKEGGSPNIRSKMKAAGSIYKKGIIFIIYYLLP